MDQSSVKPKNKQMSGHAKLHYTSQRSDVAATGYCVNAVKPAGLGDWWFSSLTSCFSPDISLAWFRSCKEHASSLLKQRALMPCLEAPKGKEAMFQALLPRAIAMLERCSAAANLHLGPQESAQLMEQVFAASLQSVVSVKRSISPMQQLSAITHITCGGKASTPWIVQHSLVPDVLSRCLPSLTALDMSHVHVGSLPDDASGLRGCRQLKRLSLTSVQLIGVTDGQMKQQASALPVVQELTLTDITGHGWAGLIAGLSSHLTHLVRNSWHGPDFMTAAKPESDACSAPRLHTLRLCLNQQTCLPDIYKVAPNLRILFCPELAITDSIDDVPLAWMQQLEDVSCAWLTIKFTNPPAADTHDKLMACGGVHLVAGRSGLLMGRCLDLRGCEAGLLSIIPHIDCQEEQIRIDTFIKMSREVTAALGQSLDCSSWDLACAAFESDVWPDLLELLPSLYHLDLQSHHVFIHHSDLRALCEAAKRRVWITVQRPFEDHALMGDDEPGFNQLENVKFLMEDLGSDLVSIELGF